MNLTTVISLVTLLGVVALVVLSRLARARYEQDLKDVLSSAERMEAHLRLDDVAETDNERLASIVTWQPSAAAAGGKPNVITIFERRRRSSDWGRVIPQSSADAIAEMISFYEIGHASIKVVPGEPVAPVFEESKIAPSWAAIPRELMHKC